MSNDASITDNGQVNTSHYNFTYKLTAKDIENGEIRVDPYFVASVWRFQDFTGCLFHILKTIARFGRKNQTSREISSIVKTATRLEQLTQ